VSTGDDILLAVDKVERGCGELARDINRMFRDARGFVDTGGREPVPICGADALGWEFHDLPESKRKKILAKAKAIEKAISAFRSAVGYTILPTRGDW
jgi:hypothetical protein